MTGATGNIGRKVVDHLVAAGAPEVRALTVNPARAALPAGVEVVRGYLRRPMENTLTWAPEIIATGAVHEPYPEGRSTPIAMDDIARVAAAALTSEGHEGRSYTLTGPEVLSRVDLACGSARPSVTRCGSRRSAGTRRSRRSRRRWARRRSGTSTRSSPAR
ncbi:hypothetical protein GCM10023215_65930 [Pseudonocardia yuanmonensis]|uniref:NAD(P)-binding domain-containing protein n=1 Tax=Pseudonocardia yuanmonensis TaxID=1095914 RepID=A0ABP8XS82_9PSEU